MRAVTRRYNLDGLKPYLEYARRTTEMIRVDRDVNEIWNVWRITAATRYGLKVRPSQEAQHTPDVILSECAV